MPRRSTSPDIPQVILGFGLAAFVPGLLFGLFFGLLALIEAPLDIGFLSGFFLPWTNFTVLRGTCVVTVVFGIPLYLLSRRHRWENRWAFPIAGALVGTLVYSTLSALDDQWRFLLFDGLPAAVLGLLTTASLSSLRFFVSIRKKLLTGALVGFYGLVALDVAVDHFTRNLTGEVWETHTVQVNLGERGYSISRNYLNNIRPHRGDRHDQAMLQVLWPSLEPHRKDNLHVWRHRDDQGEPIPVVDIEDRLLIYLSESHHDQYRELLEITEAESLQRAKGPFGLFQIQSAAAIFFLAEDHASETSDGSPLAFKCPKIFARPESILDPRIRCYASYRLADGANLFYVFSAASLGDWAEIDHAVRALVDSFRN